MESAKNCEDLRMAFDEGSSFEIYAGLDMMWGQTGAR